MNSVLNVAACSEDFEFKALAEARNYRAALLREFSPYLQGSVIEVGAGIGQITAELRENSSINRLCSIEPNAAFHTQAQARFPDLDLILGTISDLKQRENWNAILSVNVLEHIEADDAELATYHRLLQPAKGTLCLFVPARPEIYAPIDRDFGHFRRYTRSTLDSKLQRAGFAVKRIRYYNLAGYFLWWLNFCLLGKRSFNSQAVRLFDRMLFPAIHWAETQISVPPIGQSLLAVAQAGLDEAQ